MATVNVHDIGDLVRITGTLETADGTNVDPTTYDMITACPSPGMTATAMNLLSFRSDA